MAVVTAAEPVVDAAPMAASFVSAIALFHPDGLPAEVMVLPTSGAGQDSPNGPARLADRLASTLMPDGVGYILVRPTERPCLRRLLRRRGLVIAEERLHLPIWNAGLALVPTATRPLGYALDNLLPKLSLRAHLAALAGRQMGGARWLAWLMPMCGLVVRRPGARPLFDWLFRLGAEVETSSAVIVRTSWRPADGVTVLYNLPAGQASPTTIVKVGAAKQDLGPEYQQLVALGPQAQRSGVVAPRALAITQQGERQVLLQTTVPGNLAATVLAAHPAQLEPVMERILAWLGRWNRDTQSLQPLTRRRLQEELLDPAAALAPHLEGGQEFEAWLAGRFAALEGREVPWVATHNDLTMWNILLNGADGLGVIDWESARPAGLPLKDLLYAIVDGVAAAKRYGDRLAAFQACFAPAGAQAARAARWQARLCRVLNLTDDVAQLCWHATWLRHAANELAAGTGAARPFLQIVQWLVLQPQFRAETARSNGSGPQPVHSPGSHGS